MTSSVPLLLSNLSPRVTEAIAEVLIETEFELEAPDEGQDIVNWIDESSRYGAIVLGTDGGPGVHRVLRRVRSRDEHLPVMVVGEADRRKAIELMKLGATDVLTDQELARLPEALTEGIERAFIMDERIRLSARRAYGDRLAVVAQFASGVVAELNRINAIVRANLSILDEHLRSTQRYMGRCTEMLNRYVPLQAQASLAAELSGNADFLVRTGEAVEAVADCLEGSNDLQRMVHDVRVLAPRRTESPTRADIREVLKSVLAIVYPLIATRARLERDFEAVPPVTVQPGRIGQVFLNILMNAVQSVPEGDPASHRIGVRLRRASDNVLIIIEDTGIGIPEEQLREVWAPFFSTRPSGQGSGLGLSVANQVVREHGGRINLRSIVGQGTTVVMALPIEGRDMVTTTIDTLRGLVREAMLVVDANSALLVDYAQTFGDWLIVETASDADSAIRSLRSGLVFDLVVVDLGLPNGGADRLLDAIEEDGMERAREVVELCCRDLEDPRIVEGAYRWRPVTRKPLTFEFLTRRLGAS
jgi:signal transduction histidine kinase